MGEMPWLLCEDQGSQTSEFDRLILLKILRGSIRESLPVHLFNGSAPPRGTSVNQGIAALIFRLILVCKFPPPECTQSMARNLININKLETMNVWNRYTIVHK